MIEGNTKENDRYWTVGEVVPYIMEYLKEKFPESIIIREFDKVDIMILGQNIPVEIQKTLIRSNAGRLPQISAFEQSIRKQIDQNIEIYDKCWFFFDNEFLIYLQLSSNKQISINMDWMYKHYSTGLLKIFTITKSGTIKELAKDDLNFIHKLSNTCPINKDEEWRVLSKNKSKIAYNVLKNLNITTEKINYLYDIYLGERTTSKNITFHAWLAKRERI